MSKHYGKILTLKLKGRGENKIDLTNVKNIITIGVTLSEIPLQTMNFYKAKNGTHIPIISIFQLNQIYECLTLDSEKIDYLQKRVLIQKNVEHNSEEEDLLYTYLLSGFNTSEKYYIPSKEKEICKFWYTEKAVTRNFLRRTGMFNQMLCELEGKGNDKWLDKCIGVLEIPPIVQNQIERDILEEGTLMLYDNIKQRKKVIVAEVIESTNEILHKSNIRDAKKIIQIFKSQGIQIEKVLFLFITKELVCLDADLINLY